MCVIKQTVRALSRTNAQTIALTFKACESGHTDTLTHTHSARTQRERRASKHNTHTHREFNGKTLEEGKRASERAAQRAANNRRRRRRARFASRKKRHQLSWIFIIFKPPSLTQQDFFPCSLFSGARCVVCVLRVVVVGCRKRKKRKKLM